MHKLTLDDVGKILETELEGSDNIKISREFTEHEELENDDSDLLWVCPKKLVVITLENEGIKIPKESSYHSCFVCDGKNYNCTGVEEE